MAEVHVAEQIRGTVSLTSHPDGLSRLVARQVDRARAGGPGHGLNTVLVLGSTMGYGLAAAIAASWGYGADVLGVGWERAPGREISATAGWYNAGTAAWLARESGRRYRTIIGDAFSSAIKEEVVSSLRDGFRPVDLIVYSLAAPRRTDQHGRLWCSTLKPIGTGLSGTTLDLRSLQLTPLHLPPATSEEIEGTIRVMGGEDWQWWIETLLEADLLAEGCRTVAFSYEGGPTTQAIYRQGTIGKAKVHLETTARLLDRRLSAELGGGAWVSLNQALVTQAALAIPSMPLYLSCLLPELARHHCGEDCLDQLLRLLHDHLGPHRQPHLDPMHRIRLDDRELAPDIQAVCEQALLQPDPARLDIAGFRTAYRRLFGFAVEDVDYHRATEVDRPLNH